MATRQARQASPQSTTNKTFRMPLVGSHMNRNSSSAKDERFINCFPEASANAYTEQKKIYLQKRAGLATRRSYTAGNARGLFRWNGADYVAVGDTVYKDGSAHKTITGTSGHVGFTVIYDNWTEMLFFCDGTWGYVTDGTTVTTIPITIADWAADTVTAIGARVIPTTENGFFYQCIARTGDYKTHGTTEPTWPTVPGDQVVDDAVTWINKGYYGYSMATWSTPRTPSVGTQIVPTVSNGYYYECTVSGAVGGTEPSWPQTISSTVVDGAATWECVGLVDTTTPMPKSHLPYPVYLDHTLYLIALDSNGNPSSSIYNSGVRNPYSWNSIDFVDAEMYPDPLRCLTRHHNTIIAIGQQSMEFFIDEANPTGSPLSRNVSFANRIGTPAAESVASTDRIVCFIGTTNDGGFGVWKIEGYQPQKVSTEYQDRILSAEGSNIGNARGYFVRSKGHLFYVIRLTSRTLVYDPEENSWHEWSTNSSNTHANFVGAYAFDLGTGVPMILGATNGELYTMSDSAYQDYNANAILMDITTQRLDFESMHRKFLHDFHLVCDPVAASTVAIKWCDDDYVTWSNTKTISLASRTYIPNLGSFRRRAFNILYTANYDWRIEAIEVDLSLGSH